MNYLQSAKYNTTLIDTINIEKLSIFAIYGGNKADNTLPCRAIQ